MIGRREKTAVMKWWKVLETGEPMYERIFPSTFGCEAPKKLRIAKEVSEASD